MSVKDNFVKKTVINMTFFHAMVLNHGGGCEGNFIKMSAGMSGLGNDVEIITLTKKFHQRMATVLSVFYGTFFKKDGKSFYRLPDKEIRERLRNVNWQELPLREIKKEFKQENVIYSKNELLDLFILKLLRPKQTVICGMHTPAVYPWASTFHEKLHNFLYKSFIYRWLIKQCDYFRVLNEDDKIFLNKQYRIPNENIFVIGNGLDTNNFMPMSNPSKNGEFRIIFVGRLCPQKGIDTLIATIHAINSVEKFRDKIEFNIIGSGALEGTLRENIKNYKNVRIIDCIPNQDMPAFYLKHDICITPSKWETFNSVILEAQSCGLPVVAFDIPGPREMILNNETGYLVELDDTHTFISKIKYLFELRQNRPAEFKDMQTKSHENIAKKFSHDAIFHKLDLMFEKVYK